jgi:hypothetical protein
VFTVTAGEISHNVVFRDAEAFGPSAVFDRPNAS